MARGLTRVLCLHREADRGKQVQIKSSAIMYDGITSSQTVEIKGFIHKNIGSPLNSKCLSFDRITEKKFSFKQGFSHFFFPCATSFGPPAHELGCHPNETPCSGDSARSASYTESSTELCCECKCRHSVDELPGPPQRPAAVYTTDREIETVCK